jgi:hypothetical protein
VKAKGDLASSVGACAEKVFSAQSFEPRQGRAPVSVEVGIRFSTVDESSRPQLTAERHAIPITRRQLSRAGGVHLPAQQEVRPAPRERPVACPTELGLVDMAKPGTLKSASTLSSAASGASR